MIDFNDKIPVYQCTGCRTWIFMENGCDFQRMCHERGLCPECMLGIRSVKFLEAGITFYREKVSIRPANEIDLFIKIFARERLKIFESVREELYVKDMGKPA